MQWSKRAKGKSALSISFSCLFQPQGINSPGSQVSHCVQWRLALAGSIATGNQQGFKQQHLCVCDCRGQEGPGWGAGECPHSGVKPPAQCGLALSPSQSSGMLTRHSPLSLTSSPAFSVGSRLDILTISGSEASSSVQKFSFQHAMRIALQDGWDASYSMYPDQG